MTEGDKGARSTFDLLGLLGPELKEAAAAEIDLARAEISGAVGGLISAAIFGFVGVVVILTALMFALAGLIDVLVAAGFGRAAATFIVAGGLALVGVVCAVVAYTLGKAVRFVPSRALQLLRAPVSES